MSAPELPRDRTKTTITTLFCDGSIRSLPFRRRVLSLRFYALRLANAVQGVPIAHHGSPDQHISMLTMVERDAETDQVVRTMHAGFFDCDH